MITLVQTKYATRKVEFFWKVPEGLAAKGAKRTKGREESSRGGAETREGRREGESHKAHKEEKGGGKRLAGDGSPHPQRGKMPHPRKGRARLRPRRAGGKWKESGRKTGFQCLEKSEKVASKVWKNGETCFQCLENAQRGERCKKNVVRSVVFSCGKKA